MFSLYLILTIVTITINDGVVNSEILNPYEQQGVMCFDSLNVRFAGNWPFGAPRAVTYDTTRNIAFCGGGGGVYILDMIDPTNPQKISEAIHTRGSVFGLFYDSATQRLHTADYTAGCEIWDISNSSSPVKLGSYDTPGEAYGVFVSGSYAYVADYYDGGLRVIDVSDPTNPVEVGYCDTWEAYDVFVSDTFAYVADGCAGLRILNVSDPINPFEVSLYSGSISDARDVVIVGNYAYVINCSDFYQLVIVDISDPLSPQLIGTWSESSAWYALSVFVSGRYAYVTAESGRFHIVDVSDPSNPFTVNCLLTGVAYDVWHYNANAYVPDFDNGLRIIDVSDPLNPHEIGFYDTPGLAHNVFVVDPYAYVANQYGGLRIIDISNTSDPIEIGHYNAPGWTYGVFVSDTHAYVADAWAGLRIVDLSDPANPYEVGSCNTQDHARGVFVLGTYAYVTDSDGLRIIDISDPTNPQVVGYYTTPGCAAEVNVSGIYAYIADYSVGLRIIDVSDPYSPWEIGYFDPPGSGGISDLHIIGSYAYVVDGDSLLYIVDITDPSNPQEISHHSTSMDPYEIFVFGPLAYVNTAAWQGRSRMEVINVADPTNPYNVGFYDTPYYISGIYFLNPYIYVTDYEAGLQIYEFLEPGVSELTNEVCSSWLQLLQNPVSGDYIKLMLHVNKTENLAFSFYNSLGQKVKEFSLNTVSPGGHFVTLPVRGLSSGVYFLKFEAGNYTVIKKVLLIK